VLDSTPLYDAVATMDTVTLIRSALRGLLAVAGPLEARLRAACTSGDEYATSAKPQIDWEDAAAREALIDSRARDAFACLALLEGEKLGPEVSQAADLLAAVVGQDLEKGDDGSFRIARRVAPDRIISTVDPEARHGHKTSARGFDGYKGHIAVDPDAEVITGMTVTAGNVGDAAVATELLDDCLPAEEAEGESGLALPTTSPAISASSSDASSSAGSGERSQAAPFHPEITPSSSHETHPQCTVGGWSDTATTIGPSQAIRPGRRRQRTTVGLPLQHGPAVAALTIAVRWAARRRAGAGACSSNSTPLRC
jgi:hypothetical protein